MRHDEYPIVVFLRSGFDLPNLGIDFGDGEKNLALVGRGKRCGVC